MRNVARLAEFSSMAAACEDAVFYTTTSDPTHVGTIAADKIPADWSIIDFGDGIPDTEETLALPKGTRIVLFSASNDTAAFYLVRGKREATATDTAFKQMRDVSDTWRSLYDKKVLECDERDALIAAQAAHIEKLERKVVKLKRKMKDRDDADALSFADQVVSGGIEQVARLLGVPIPTEDEGAGE